MMKSNIRVQTVLLIILMSMPSFASDSKLVNDDLKIETIKSTERKDRVVDMAAVGLQKEAIARIESLINNPIHKNKEADLLFQLGIARLEAASIQFRIAHEKAHRSGAQLNLDGYYAEMGKSIEVLSRLINVYPKDPRYPEILYLRGNAYDESKKKDLAKKDYNELVKKYPEIAQSNPASMRLAEFAVEEDNHQLAIQHLKTIEKRTNDPLYPFAIYKMAWAYFNLTQIPEAMKYLGIHISYYDDLFKKNNGLPSSETAIRENTLKDISLFYFEGLQKNISGYSLQRAFDAFENNAGISATDSIVIKFTGLLRARNFDDELKLWLQLIQKSEYSPSTKLSCYNTLFENQQNRRQYFSLGFYIETIKSLIINHPELEKSDSAKELKQIVDASSKDIHKIIQENKKSNKTNELMIVLEDIYAMARLLSNEDVENQIRVDYNLAETYFELKNYTKATQFYWNAFRISQGLKNKSKDLVSEKELFMRATSSRFKELETSGIVPKEIKAVSLNKNILKPFQPMLVEWISNLKFAQDNFKLNHEEQLVIRRYAWESQRIRYSLGDVNNVINEFQGEFEKLQKPDEIHESKISLWMDTLTASEDWINLNLISKRFNSVNFKSSALAAQVKNVEGDSWIKLIEADKTSGNDQLVLEKTKTCQKEFSSDLDKIHKCKVLAIEIYSKQNKHQEVLEEINSITNLKDKNIMERLLFLKEKSYIALAKFDELLNDLIQSNDQSRKNLKKVFETALFVQTPKAYKTVLQQKEFCKTLIEQCRLLKALLYLNDTNESFKISFDEIFKAHKLYRSVYSIATVNSFKTSLSDRMKVLRNAFSTWKDLDSFAHWSILPVLDSWLIEELNTNRNLLRSNYPLNASNPHSLTLRLTRVQDFETSMTVLSKSLPYSHLKTSLLKGVQLSLNDLIDDLNKSFPVESKEFVPALRKKSESLSNDVMVAGPEKISELEARLDILAQQAMEEDVKFAAKNLKEERWVLAKYLQDRIKTKNKLSESWMNAKFFFKLKAYHEAEALIEQAEALAQPLLASKGGTQ